MSYVWIALVVFAMVHTNGILAESRNKIIRSFEDSQSLSDLYESIYQSITEIQQYRKSHQSTIALPIEAYVQKGKHVSNLFTFFPLMDQVNELLSNITFELDNENVISEVFNFDTKQFIHHLTETRIRYDEFMSFCDANTADRREDLENFAWSIFRGPYGSMNHILAANYLMVMNSTLKVPTWSRRVSNSIAQSGNDNPLKDLSKSLLITETKGYIVGLYGYLLRNFLNKLPVDTDMEVFKKASLARANHYLELHLSIERCQYDEAPWRVMRLEWHGKWQNFMSVSDEVTVAFTSENPHVEIGLFYGPTEDSLLYNIVIGKVDGKNIQICEDVNCTLAVSPELFATNPIVSHFQYTTLQIKWIPSLLSVQCYAGPQEVFRPQTVHYDPNMERITHLAFRTLGSTWGSWLIKGDSNAQYNSYWCQRRDGAPPSKAVSIADATGIKHLCRKPSKSSMFDDIVRDTWYESSGAATNCEFFSKLSNTMKTDWKPIGVHSRPTANGKMPENVIIIGETSNGIPLIPCRAVREETSYGLYSTLTKQCRVYRKNTFEFEFSDIDVLVRVEE